MVGRGTIDRGEGQWSRRAPREEAETRLRIAEWDRRGPLNLNFLETFLRQGSEKPGTASRTRLGFDKEYETPYSAAILPRCVGHREWFDPFPTDGLDDFQNHHGMITALVDDLADGTFQIRRRVTENGCEG